jgi:tripartite-type tricarboxylate transporter receptor subunit TctC
MGDARVWEDDEPMLSRRRFVGLVATSALTSLVRPAGAQGWPTRHVRIIVPFVPGGATDVIARVMGNRLSEAWGQQVVVENRSGAGANIGAQAAALSDPVHALHHLGTARDQSVSLFFAQL